MQYALPSVNKPNNIQSYPTLGLLTATTAHTMSRRCLVVHWMELTFPYFPPAAGYQDFVNRKGWPSIILQALVDDTLIHLSTLCTLLLSLLFSHTLSLSLPLSLSPSLSVSCSHIHSLSVSCSHIHSLSLSLALTYTLSLSLSP